MSLFARVKYCDKYKDINAKCGLLTKNESIRDWYVKKFNPITTKEIEIEGYKGIEVRVPILKNEKGEKVDIVIDNTLKWLNDRKVDIISWEGLVTDEMLTTNNKEIIPFYIKPAIIKACSMKNIELKKAEVVIIDGGLTSTAEIVNEICNEVNYITILTEDTDVYREICKDIFINTGLEIMLTSFSKELIKGSDIVINGCKIDNSIDYLYKKNSVYIDLSNDKTGLSELIRKRGDMLIADDVRIKSEDGFLTTSDLELVLYTRCREYRLIKSKGYENDRYLGVKSFLDDRKISFVAFYQGGKVVKGKNY